MATPLSGAGQAAASLPLRVEPWGTGAGAVALGEIGELEVHAYVDSALDPAQCRWVNARLNRSPQGAVRIAAYCTQNVQLRTLFASPEGPLPPVLQELAGRVSESISWSIRLRRGLWAIASIATLLLLILAGWWGLERLTPSTPGDGLIAAPTLGQNVMLNGDKSATASATRP